MYCEFCIYIFSIYFCDRSTWNFPTGSQAYFYLILWFYRKGNSKFYKSQIKILFVSASIFFLLLKICIRFDYSAITLKYQNFFKLRDKKNISNYFEYEYICIYFFFYFYQTIPVYLVITDQRQRRGLYDVRHYPCLKSRSRVSRIKTKNPRVDTTGVTYCTKSILEIWTSLEII